VERSMEVTVWDSLTQEVGVLGSGVAGLEALGQFCWCCWCCCCCCCCSECSPHVTAGADLFGKSCGGLERWGPAESVCPLCLSTAACGALCVPLTAPQSGSACV
jgi:hypothetical protein